MQSHEAPIDLSADVQDLSWEPPQVWREGRKIVMMQGATLPDRCVKCNGEPEVKRLKTTLYWHTPALYLLIIFPGLLIYALVAIAVRKRAVVHIPMCARHRAYRRRLIATAWLAVLAAFACLGYAAAERSGIAAIVGIVLILGGLILGFVGSQTLSAAHIDRKTARLTGACKEYVQALPSN